MTDKTQRLYDSVMALPEEACFDLVGELLDERFPETDDVGDDEFLAELERRSAELEKHPEMGVSWDDVKNSLWGELPDDVGDIHDQPPSLPASTEQSDYRPLLEAILALPEEKRNQLVEKLIDTVHPVPPEIAEDEYLAELERRREASMSGRSKPIPWREVMGES